VPSSALTRFLKQGLARGMCPLCRVAHKLEREYVWYFFDEYSGQEWALQKVREAHGFCAQHAEALRRVEVDGLKSTLGISQVYLDTVQALNAELEAMPDAGPLVSSACPVCAYRDEGVGKNARYLLDEIAESERSRARFLGSPGLCVPHFRLVWAEADERERDLVLGVERRAVGALAAELAEHVRKQGDEAKGEPKGAEADSWLRAIYLMSGWPEDMRESLTTVITQPAAPEAGP
jgi:hypothetical protein